jgi:DNA-binding transcriptional LysR family regulator
MRVFQRVAEEGGFAAAARKLELDPAVVTRLVADLERHLGAPLLQRTTRRVSLTPAGEDYLARVRSILDEIDEAETSVRGQATAFRGRLRILALASIASNILAPSIGEFLRQYPDVQVDIHTSYGADPPLEDYDLTFVGGYTSIPADVVTREITAAEIAFYASPEYLGQHGAVDALAHLAKHRLVLLRRAAGVTQRLRVMDTQQGDLEDGVEIGRNLICDDVQTVLRATLDGVGIGTLSRALVAPYLITGVLCPVLEPWIIDRIRVRAVYPSRKMLAPRARAFLEHILASVGSGERGAMTTIEPPTMMD